MSPSLLAQLRTGDWLDRRRIGLLAAILLAVELVFFAFIVAGTHGWIVPLDKPCTTDFVSFYAAGALADAGTPALAYDQAAHLATEEAITARGIQYQFFFYPPVYLLLCAVLARLPYLVAFVGFAAAGLFAYLAVARRILDDTSGAALLVLIAFPAVFWNIGLGQNAFLSAALFGGATLLVDRRPVVAGILFGALCYKPHFGLLIPLALVAAGRWRTIAAAGATVAALIIASVALYGLDTWRDYVAASAAAPAMYGSGRILFAGFVSPFGAVRLVGGGVTLAYGVQAAMTATGAALVWAVWRRGLSLPLRAATLASATLVAVPLALLYDLMLGAVAVAWLARDEGPAPAWEKTVLALLVLSLVDARNLAEEFHLPVTSLAALALFVLVARRVFAELGRAALPFMPASPARLR
ncbi:MAG TPA: glycosyltransferase family 87 protein [Stellaceae bacterium]|nr:glycosyltransferase family 87 protein [Stellaceae bacterium]